MIAVAAAVALLAITAQTSTASPGDGVDDVPEQPFRDGSWSGTLAASGVVVGSFPDAEATMDTLMSGSFHASVLDGEVTAGTWTLNGSSDGFIMTEFGQGEVDNNFFGAGPVRGDGSGLQLGGTVDTTWRLSFGGRTDTHEDPIQLGPFDVEVLHLDCNTLIGRWEQAFETQVADAGGWQATLGGNFQASHLGDGPAGPLADLVEGVAGEAQALVTDLTTGTLGGPDGTVVIDSSLRQRFRSVIAAANGIEVQIAELESATDCLFPAGEGTFATTITSLIQEAARVLLSEQALDAAGLEFLAEQLLAVGGAGPAALPNPHVTELEDLLAARVSEVLNDAVISDPDTVDQVGCSTALPCLPNEPRVVQALRAAELLFQPVTIDGQTYDWAEVHTWLVLAEIGEPS